MLHSSLNDLVYINVIILLMLLLRGDDPKPLELQTSGHRKALSLLETSIKEMLLTNSEMVHSATSLDFILLILQNS